MIKESMTKAINKQIAKELFSSNLYLSLAGYFHFINLNGMANWMRSQSSEELTHAYKLFDYLLDRGAKPVIEEIGTPRCEWDSPIAAFEYALEHERKVTESINELAGLAQKENDLATQVLLHWFISEQVEEESTVSELVDRIRMAQDSPGGMFILDNELRQSGSK